MAHFPKKEVRQPEYFIGAIISAVVAIGTKVIGTGISKSNQAAAKKAQDVYDTYTPKIAGHQLENEYWSMQVEKKDYSQYIIIGLAVVVMVIIGIIIFKKN